MQNEILFNVIELYRQRTKPNKNVTEFLAIQCNDTGFFKNNKQIILWSQMCKEEMCIRDSGNTLLKAAGNLYWPSCFKQFKM